MTAVERALQAIQSRDGELRAWVHVDADGALSRARSIQKESPRGPLHGVALGVKDIIDAAGMPTEYNSPIYRGNLAYADAACVALLRRAGCVVVGKTSTAEFAYATAPATRNPFSSAHSPGGSSSGSAAAVGAGMVPLALGTQTGGSVIRPAAYCGTIGFKPTFGAVSRAGVKPLSESLDTVGLFAATLEIAAAAFQALSGRVLADLSIKPPVPRVGFARTSRWKELDEASRGALESAAARLNARECALPPAADALFEEHDRVMKFEAARALAWEQAEHRSEISARLLERLDEGAALTAEQYRRARQCAADARRQMVDLMRDYDLLLTAAAPGEAPKGLDSTGSSLFNRIWTALGTPCVTLPFAKGPQGLPIGAQLVGAADEDETLLIRCRWAEKRLTG